MIASKKIWQKHLGLLIVLIPLTNSAITDCVNCSYRLIPLLPVVAIIISLGINKFFPVKQSPLKIIVQQSVIFLVITTCIIQVVYFFLKEPASKGQDWQDYLSTHLVYLLQKIPANDICLIINRKNYQYFDLLHVKEQQSFFLPGKIINKKIESSLSEKEIYVSDSCSLENNFVAIKYCPSKLKYSCPLGEAEDMIIKIDRSLILNTNER